MCRPQASRQRQNKHIKIKKDVANFRQNHDTNFLRKRNQPRKISPYHIELRVTLELNRRSKRERERDRKRDKERERQREKNIERERERENDEITQKMCPARKRLGKRKIHQLRA